MFRIDKNDETPVYEQLRTQILDYITSGVLCPGDKLPSIRVIASELRVNFNTVKKVIAQLESVGVIRTVAGGGCYVADGAARNDGVLRLAEASLRAEAVRARAAGMTEAEAIDAVKSAFNRTEAD